MEINMKIWSCAVGGGARLWRSFDAEAARRLGGGGSVGRQSGNVTQREARQAAPRGAGAAQPGRTGHTAAAPTPAAAAPKRPWGAMLGGLAAGLGLAWLANSLGLGAAFAQFLLIALLAAGRHGRDRLDHAVAPQAAQPSAPATRSRAPGARGRLRPCRRASTARTRSATMPRPGRGSATAWPSTRASTRPGQRACRSARPWRARRPGACPPGFDTDGFLAAAKRNFVTLQDAWDRADIAHPALDDDRRHAGRDQAASWPSAKASRAAQPNKTEVVMLEAQLLGIEELGDDYMASVEFSGMIREEPSAGAEPLPRSLEHDQAQERQQRLAGGGRAGAAVR